MKNDMGLAEPQPQPPTSATLWNCPLYAGKEKKKKEKRNGAATRLFVYNNPALPAFADWALAYQKKSVVTNICPFIPVKINTGIFSEGPFEM